MPALDAVVILTTGLFKPLVTAELAFERVAVDCDKPARFLY